jgi:hypothetical protein
MTTMAVPKITRPERSLTALHLIQAQQYAIASSTFFNSSISKTMPTFQNAMTDFG